MGAHAAALLIVVLAALLRLDAFVGKYGTLDHPAWARIATHEVAPFAARLRPANVRWASERNPYVGGDPINHLKYARQMESFYQPQVREPVFLASTRLALWFLDGQDAAVSLASAAGSILAVFATYLLGTALWSPAAGLLASLLLAIETEAITWAPDGWRDDTFGALVLLAAWALLRLYQRPSFSRSLVAGALCGFVCLSRLTSFTFVLPAFVWIVAAAAPGERRKQLECVGVAFVVATALVVPYLMSCALASGDPLLALNFHTTYYRFAEGADVSRPVSAVEYLRTKLVSRPIATLDTAFIGVFVDPFSSKFRGLNNWVPWLGGATAAAAVAGLALWPFMRRGRLLLVVLLLSLVPFAFTWNLGSGRQWRFTMHVYPIYLVAAAAAVVGLIGALVSLWRGGAPMTRQQIVRVGRQAAVVVVVALTGIALYLGLPWLVVNEAIAAGDSTSVETGPRDALFYRAGWSPPHRDGITVRVSTAEWGVIHIPLPVRRDYDLVLRLDPVALDSQQRVRVQLNRRPVGALDLVWNPERVASYRLRLPADVVRVGRNELVLIPESMVAAGSAGLRFAWLEPGQLIGVRLWYVRVLP